MSVIYIIEDITEMANLISLYLAKAQMSPRVFCTAEEALEALKASPSGRAPDLIILDLNLPGMSGFDFLKHLADGALTSAPVIILSARDSDEDIIKGLDLGAAEFVTKPFSPRVLAARVQSHLRQKRLGNEGQSYREDAVRFGEYTLLKDSYLLKKGNAKVPLSNKEFAVLECLVRHNGTALTPESIYSEVWGTQYGDITAVAVYVARLRHKIEDDAASPRFLKTVFGKGYMFDIDGGKGGESGGDGSVERESSGGEEGGGDVSGGKI